jgi:hypothetical protein
VLRQKHHRLDWVVVARIKPGVVGRLVENDWHAIVDLTGSTTGAATIVRLNMSNV